MLADLARGKLRKKLPALRAALAGRFRAHHAFLISQLLADSITSTRRSRPSGRRSRGRLVPFATELTQLDTIHGIATRTAEVIIAEIGVDMSRFPSDRYLASWAGLCPGNHEECRQAQVGQDAEGEPLAADGAHRGCGRRDPYQGQRAGGALPATDAA